MRRYFLTRIISIALLLLFISNLFGYGLTSTRALARDEAKPTARLADERLAMEGDEAIDYLKQQGVYERVRQQVRAASHTTSATPGPMTGAMQMQPASCLNWVEEIQAVGSDGEAFDRFGVSVVVSGDTMVVGANTDDVGANTDQGSAYIFERNQGGANNWGLAKHLTASDGTQNNRFGNSVAISGDTIVVGAASHGNFQGSAYIFERNAGGANNWGEIKQIFASDGADFDAFGTSVAISGDTIVVGASGDTVGSNAQQGSAYIFERDLGGANNWGEIKHLFASDGAAVDEFGTSVAISGNTLGSDTIIIGARSDAVGGDLFQGSAYVFERNLGGTNNWGLIKHLTASDGAAGDQFGQSVAISGDTIVVGANEDAVGGNNSQGSAYIFERSAGGPNSWGEIKHLFASDGAASDQFGQSVAISGDTIVVGANEDAVGGNNSQGSAYVFERNQSGADNWGEVKHLTASDGSDGDQFGNSVAINGDTIVGGAPLDTFGSNQFQGSAYIFERNAGGANNWGEVKKLIALGGEANDKFGISVSISGDTMVVGAFFDDVGGNQDQGSAYIFERNAGGADNWGLVKQTTASDGAAFDSFGISVSISGDTLVVGAFGDTVSGNAEQGSAYIFERNAGGANNWGEVKHLIASDGADGDQFGQSVALSGDTIVVSAPDDAVGGNAGQGSAYIFERNAGGANNWGEVKHLFASDGAQSDFFGTSVSINSDTIVVGANQDAVGGIFNQGSAYIFERNAGGANNWGEVKHLFASDGAQSDFFGTSVALSGDTVVVSASFDKVGSNFNQGSAYVFERNAGGANNWGEVKHLFASDGTEEDQFGTSVSISGDTVVVGAANNNVGGNNAQGSAYVFERDLGGTNNWGEVTQLTASDSAAFDSFGTSVAISNNAIVVGAPDDDFGGVTNNGSAYLFVTDCPPTILPATLNRQRNSSQNEFIASVNDDRTPADNLSVNEVGSPTGITVTDIVNTNGTVTATVSVACNAALGQNFVSLVVEDGEDLSTAMLIINVSDAPPVITCPPNQTSVTTTPNGASVAVNYPAPTVTDNCSSAIAVCSPPSGSTFPAGVTTVTCTATDTAGLQSSCSFTVTVFNACLQDNSNAANVLLFNTATGDYRFCCAGTVYTGKGSVIKQGNVYTLTHNPATRRVLAKLDTAQKKGTATLQEPVSVMKCSITDSNTLNNSCLCN